jgi:hypothetical protein
VHRNVAAEHSEGNLARRLWVLVPVNRKAEKSEANREPIDLQPHRLPAQARARREAEESVDKGPMVNRPGSQEPERQLRLSKGRGNRSAERKKARGLHRRGHNFVDFTWRLRGEKIPEPLLFESIIVGVRRKRTPIKRARESPAYATSFAEATACREGYGEAGTNRRKKITKPEIIKPFAAFVVPWADLTG